MSFMTNASPKFLLPLAFAFLFFTHPSALWAKKHHGTPTPTSTPTAIATFTPTATPTPPSRVEKLYTFDAMWGSKGANHDQLNAPEDIDISPDGKMVIADTGNNRVVVWDSNGKPQEAYGSFGTVATWRNSPQFDHPCAVYVHPSKQIYVADTHNQRIVVLDEGGLVVSTWGTQGKDNGQFNLPHGIGKDHYGNIFVLDSGNSRIQVFSGLGIFNYVWGSFGTEPGLMNMPLGMALNNIDQVILADSGNFRIQVFNDQSGATTMKTAPVTFLGWYGDGPYQFKEPGGVVVTKTGTIAVADGATGRVEFFNSRFEFIGQWKAKDEILTPNYAPRFRGIACDSDNRIYITDMQTNAILRLKPVKAPEEPTFVPAKPTPTALEENPYGGVGYPIR